MLTAQQVQLLEQSAFDSGVTADSLMEKVGRSMAKIILTEHPVPGKAIAFLGRGHNAGDALVVLRYLQIAGWHIAVRMLSSENELAPLTQQKLELLTLELPEPLLGSLILLDGLLGIGTQGEIRDPLRTLADEMNHLRLSTGAQTIAMDLPSGLNADTGENGYVIADHTLTVGVPKIGLIADHATDFVGRITLIEVEELPLPDHGDKLITSKTLLPYFPPRPFTFHKGNAGRVAIIAGSTGFTGAAILAAEGALRAGAGLITLWTESIPHTSPEIMVRQRSSDWTEVLSLQPDALVIGPGLGINHSDSLFQLLESSTLPTVLDADALNLIAQHDHHYLLTENIIVTPHPKELERLHTFSSTRAEKVRDFTQSYPATILYKGARTIVSQADQPLYYNTTGTPGMATGGQGDLLSGVIGALLAQGLSPLRAGQAGAWLTGRAAELTQISEQSLTPSEVALALGKAFNSLRS